MRYPGHKEDDGCCDEDITCQAQGCQWLVQRHGQDESLYQWYARHIST